MYIFTRFLFIFSDSFKKHNKFGTFIYTIKTFLSYFRLERIGRKREW